MGLFSSPYHVEKSIQIQADAATVYQHITDPDKNKQRSPWLILEPDAVLSSKGEIGEVGYVHCREGELIGKGEQEITHIEPTRIERTLRFFKPFKSTSTVWMSLTEENGKTTVTWHIDASLPFFLAWMKGQMKAMLGMDFERGLVMLRDLIEKGALHTSTEYSSQPMFLSKFHCLGILRTSPKSDIGKVMTESYHTLLEFAQEHNITQVDAPIAFYMKFDMKKQIFTYVSAIVVSAEDAVRAKKLNPKGIIVGDFPGGNTFKVTHHGSYDYLGNSWAGGMMFLRAKKLKQKKGTVPFERYVKDPAKHPDVDLVTEIHFCLK